MGSAPSKQVSHEHDINHIRHARQNLNQGGPMKVADATTCLGMVPLLIGLAGCAGGGDHQTPGRFEALRAADRDGGRTAERRIANSRMAERVREALTAGVDYKYDGVMVLATEGEVQLGGSVDTSVQRASAEEVARKVVGVRSVRNNVAVKN
jgi:hypothetical protein